MWENHACNKPSETFQGVSVWYVTYRQSTITGPGPGQSRSRCNASECDSERDNKQATNHSSCCFERPSCLLTDDNDRECSVCDFRQVSETEQHDDDDRVCENAVQYNRPEHGSWNGVTGFSNFFGHVDSAIEACLELATLADNMGNTVRTDEAPGRGHKTEVEANEWIGPARIRILFEEDEVGGVSW
jgi:hypothetical protein